jgi:acetyl esterase/lipase
LHIAAAGWHSHIDFRQYGPAGEPEAMAAGPRLFREFIGQAFMAGRRVQERIGEGDGPRSQEPSGVQPAAPLPGGALLLPSALALFNALIPKDRRSRLVAGGLAYGPGARHRLDIYGPVRSRQSLPVIQFIYGGSWDSGKREHYAFAGRALAALGYVVVIADYRVRPEAEYPAFLEDGAAAFGWISEHIAGFGGDPRRMGLVGHSAGAYNAAMLALAPHYLKALGLSQQVRAVAGIAGPYDFYPFDAPISLRTFGAVRGGAATQPIRYVSAHAPPMLLLTGDRDCLVHPRNTSHMAAALAAAGVPVVERHYPTLGHAVTVLALARILRGVAPILADLKGFLGMHLVGETAPAPAAPLASRAAVHARARPTPAGNPEPGGT